MVVQHNLTAMNANRHFGINNNKLSKSLEKLSSGYAINRAGDNAAGLAVSEKMRAQISGLTQASKNAEDGISMTQTFEGALTETDSILQRMRSLAVQSANGSYDNSVDRAAIQLEYDQLNDELDQIADTDYNGVVVLNGGKMADGLEAVDGKFDYANKEAQIISDAKEALAADTSAAQDAYTKANTDYSNTKYDLSANGGAQEWNSVDNSSYDKDAADDIWQALHITSDGTGTGDAKTDVVNSLDVTFTYNKADNTWTATSAVGNDGKKITDSALLEAAFATTATTVTDATGNGGFVLDDSGVNAIFDATAAKTGDTVTLTFTNDSNSRVAPNNIGFAEDSVKVESTGTTAIAAPTLALSGVKDENMTQEIADAFNGLNGLEYSAKYGETASTLTSVMIGGTDVSTAINTTGAAFEINGQNYWIKADAATGGTITISTANADGTAAVTALATITNTAANTAAATTGSVSGTFALDTAKFGAASNIDVTVGKDAALGTSNDAKKVLDDAKAALDNLKATNIDDYDSAKAYLDAKGVSVSDSNDASTAKMTYTNNITLQVGARTKDSVNFTLSYESDGIGGLEDDLNCTAKGLGTDKLSLATQEGANAAIDKIDNAINKVSMVRGSFGALQNRLEHKIDNLNTTNENLTAAESRIRDTDMATEMMNFTKNQILSQASQSMLAQANQLPQGVLSLLQ